MYRSILALLATSCPWEPVLRRAAEAAERHGSLLHVAVDTVSATRPERLPAELEAELRVRDVAVRTVGPVEVHDAEALASSLHEVRADLLVTGRGVLSGAWAVPKGTPTLLVSDEAPTDRNGYEHTVVCMDGPRCESILPYATALASDAGMRLTMLGVVRPGYLIAGRQDVRVDLESARRARDALEAYLDGVAQRLRSRGLDIGVRVVTRARPPAAVVELVEEAGADLVAAIAGDAGSQDLVAALAGTARFDMLVYRPRERPLKRWTAEAARQEGA